MRKTKDIFTDIIKTLSVPGKTSEKIEGIYNIVKTENLDKIEQAAIFVTLFNLVYSVVTQMEEAKGAKNGKPDIRPQHII